MIKPLAVCSATVPEFIILLSNKELGKIQSGVNYLSQKKKKHHLIVSGISMTQRAEGRNTIIKLHSKVIQADLLFSQVKGFQNKFL